MSNALHEAMRLGKNGEEEQLRLISESADMLQAEDDSWEGWLPIHHAARWGVSHEVMRRALQAFPEAAKTASRGGYEPLHLAAMGGHREAVTALISVYPEGVFKKDNNGRTPLDEAREGGHDAIVADLLALPGAADADAAEQQLRAAKAEELMRPDDASDEEEQGVQPMEDAEEEDTVEDEEEDDEGSFAGPARSLANRMFRAASSALWRREEPTNEATRSQIASFFVERAKYIPLRLELSERKMLRLLESVLHVSQYTDRVEAITANPAKRQQAQMREVHAVLTGLLLACDYKAGQQVLADSSFSDYEVFFQRVFETVRRYKIMNPEKLRDTYGKLIYMLQDANSPELQEHLEFSLVLPIRTVYSKLKETGCLALLQDEQMSLATRLVAPEPGKTRAMIAREIKMKEAAIESLARRYSCAELPAEQLKQCLYSIGDNNAYLYQARDPVDKMISYLTTLFSPESTDDESSLAIAHGQSGARLTHSHERQYAFVLQSLTLWREIANDMFRLWYLAEDDLLRPANGYELRDTGQGHHRVQPAPRTARAMQQLLHATKTKTSGNWVGSSLIHLGDSNVPNALMFIDKYSQVEHILNPILATLEALPSASEKDAAISKWIQSTFGGVAQLRKAILVDFFRYAFDGSGADNFFDAGSCIDGRLTSAWNWCSQLPSKPFFLAFRLTGFTSFNGEFQQ